LHSATNPGAGIQTNFQALPFSIGTGTQLHIQALAFRCTFSFIVKQFHSPTRSSTDIQVHVQARDSPANSGPDI
jgi:hypothetical protein